MVYIKKKKPNHEVLEVVREMISLKMRGTRLETANVSDRVEIIIVWEDADMEKEYNRLQEKMNELVKREANRGTSQRSTGKSYKRKD